MATRRDFLKAASLLAGGAGMAGVIPASVKRAFAIEPTPGSTYKDAEHIVVQRICLHLKYVPSTM